MWFMIESDHGVQHPFTHYIGTYPTADEMKPIRDKLIERKMKEAIEGHTGWLNPWDDVQWADIKPEIKSYEQYCWFKKEIRLTAPGKEPVVMYEIDYGHIDSLSYWHEKLD